MARKHEVQRAMERLTGCFPVGPALPATASLALQLHWRWHVGGRGVSAAQVIAAAKATTKAFEDGKAGR